MGVYLRGKTYYMKFTIQGIQVHQSCRTSKKHEALAIEKREKKKLKLLLSDPKEIPTEKSTSPPKGMKLSEALEKHYKRTWSKQKDGVKAYNTVQLIIKTLKNPYLKDINLEMIETLRCRLEATGKSGATINRHLARLKTILNKAHKVWGVTDSVPYFEMYKEKSRHRVITIYEEKQLLQALDRRDIQAGYVARLLADTGMRVGECLQLTSRYIDLEKRRIYIREELDQKTKGWRVILCSI